MSKFHGVIPPVVTPLHADGSVDFASYTKVLEHLIQGGCHGLFILGSTSEVSFHTSKVRQEIIEHSTKIVNGRVPVIAGVIDTGTERVIENAKAAKDLGVDGIVATTPFYALTNQQEAIDHFRRIRDTVDSPLIAYDLPVCVHTKLARATTVQLAREGVICGLKDSSGDDGNLRYVLLDTKDIPDFFAMTGAETVVDSALMMGAHGVVPGLGNVDPAGYVRLWDLVQKGDYQAARKEQERLCRLFEIVWVGAKRVSPGATGVGGFKTAMELLGIISTNVMTFPRANLNNEERNQVAQILRETGLLN